MIQHPEEKKLLVIKEFDGIEIARLRIPLLFRSLVNCSSYKEVIDSLLAFYNQINSNCKEMSAISFYQKKANTLSRPLNNEEIKEYFHINDGDILSEKDILEEVKNYINYRLAFEKLFVSNLRLVVSIAKKKQC